MTGLPGGGVTTHHEATKACRGQHCHSCNIDEPVRLGDRIYICCVECGHVYRTAGQLRRAYRRQVVGHRWSEIPWWRILWRAATIRARHIYFCQECIHDF